MVALKVVTNDYSTNSGTIPGSIDDLRGVADAFLTTGWTLAASVWAWTENTGRGGPPRDPKAQKYTLSAFAELGIRGLTSRVTVTRYRAIWQSAIDAGLATAVAPGEQFEIPDAPFGLIGESETDEDEPTPTPRQGGGGGPSPKTPEPDDYYPPWQPDGDGDPKAARDFQATHHHSVGMKAATELATMAIQFPENRATAVTLLEALKEIVEMQLERINDCTS